MPSRRDICALILPIATLAAATPAVASPQSGERQWIDCATGHIRGAQPYSVWPPLWRAQRAGNARRAALLERIAHVPQAKWLAGRNVRRSPRRVIGQHVANTIAPEWGGPNCRTRYDGRAGAGDPYVGSYPVFAIRQLDHEACSRSYHGGRAWNRVRNGRYLPWIRAFVAALRPIDRRATVILEPDGLPVMPRCLSRRAVAQRYALMRATNRILGRVPNLTTYIDIGSSAWLGRGRAIRMLRRAGVRHIRGFALNTTHFNHTRNELRYGNVLARRLGKHYVVNTAENGRGGVRNPRTTAERFCNPVNAGLGPLPTTRTASPRADAYLWISRPGLSSAGRGDNRICSRGPLGNVFWMPKALQEARRAVFTRAPWPPAPL